MCYTQSGYIMFSLKKLKFYVVWGPGAGGRGPDNLNTLKKVTSKSLLAFAILISANSC